MTPRAVLRRGYTVIEVLIALSLLAIGASGVIALQKVTTVGNRDARNLTVATQIARTWVERLRTDAVVWNHPSPSNATLDDLSDTLWLKQVNTAGAGCGANCSGWFRPVDDATRGSPAFDAFGNDVHDVDAANATFCTNVRLAWLYGPPPGVAPPYLVRAEVRVFWLRDGGGGLAAAGLSTICDSSFTNWTALDGDVGRFHWVYLTSAIKQNTAP